MKTKAIVLGAVLATTFGVSAQAANAIWDGHVIVTSTPPAACGLRKSMAFPAVYRPKIAGVNTEVTQANLYLGRNTVHLMPDDANSQLNGSGTWSGLVILENGLVVAPSGVPYNFTLKPSTITVSTTNIDFSGTITVSIECGSVSLRGGFTKRP